MLPQYQMNDILHYEGYSEEVQPSYTYKMLIDDEKIVGHIDEQEALAQAIYKQINTEADMYPIYTNYGIKKRDLFGKPKPYAYMEIQRRIKEKLILDDRINRVHTFIYDEENSVGGNLVFSFEVDSIFGNFEMKEVLEI